MPALGVVTESALGPAFLPFAVRIPDPGDLCRSHLVSFPITDLPACVSHQPESGLDQLCGAFGDVALVGQTA
jgi:hypothetical protein